MLFLDCLGGLYGDYSRDLHEVWHAKLDRPQSESEQATHQREIREAKKQVELEQKQRHAEAAKKASSIWARSPLTTDHPYLIEKGVKAHGMRLHEGKLVIPVYMDDGVVSLQFIAPNGDKHFLKGGRISGGYCCLGETENSEIVCIAEGFATAASIREATGHPVIVAFNANNLEPVAKAIRLKLPQVQIIICADDDVNTEGNPGVTYANKAAQAVGAEVAVPTFGDPRPEYVTDFNDMASLLGFDAVKQAINAASDPAQNVEADESDWPDLVPLDAPNLPCLDIAHLPAWAGDFVRAIAVDTETPPELAAGMALSACAVPAARRLRVSVKSGYFEPCNLWVVVALPPGNRKSAVQSAATAPLSAWQRDQAVQMQPEINRKTSEQDTSMARVKELRSQAARQKDAQKSKELAKKAADIEAGLSEIPTLPQIWTSDATPEELGSLLADNSECMAWLSSEGGIFDLLQGRYSNRIPNLDLVLKSHSGDPERVDRKSRPPVYLRCPLLSVGLSPQPDVLKGLAFKPGFRGRGLLGRFLYLLPRSPLGFRSLQSDPVPKAVRDAYESGIFAMLSWETATDENGDKCPHFLSLSDEARSKLHKFAQTIEVQMRPGGDFENFTDWAGKAPGAAVRIAGVLHGIKHAYGRPWETPITAEAMNAATQIMAVFGRHSLAALDMMGADPKVAAARHVWEWIERGRLSSFTVREAFNALRGTFSRVQYLRDALDVLVERGYIKVIEPTREGRGRPPSEVVLVRPNIRESWRSVPHS